MSNISIANIQKLEAPVLITEGGGPLEYTCPYDGIMDIVFGTGGSTPYGVSVDINNISFADGNTMIPGGKDVISVPVSAGDVLKFTCPSGNVVGRRVYARWYK